MVRLQELQLTVAGGSKIISGVSLSPISTKGYMRTSLRCKQESLRMKNSTPRKSPLGSFQPLQEIYPTFLMQVNGGECHYQQC
ncbi:hypothetical protein ERO13_D08G115550v2 [Gossypium hirsutum]|nr:hypothetical protein ERO13_D08G115550v2 [Gossypium hirsutum]